MKDKSNSYERFGAPFLISQASLNCASATQSFTPMKISMTNKMRDIPWSGNKWCLFLKFTNRSTITRLRKKSKDDVVFISLSYCFQIVFICFVSNTGKRVIILNVLMAMHWKQNSTTPDHGIVSKLDLIFGDAQHDILETPESHTLPTGR